MFTVSRKSLIFRLAYFPNSWLAWAQSYPTNIGFLNIALRFAFEATFTLFDNLDNGSIPLEGESLSSCDLGVRIISLAFFIPLTLTLLPCLIIIFTIVLGLIISIATLIEVTDKRKVKKDKVEEPGTLALMFKSVKDKTCFKLKVVS